MNTNLSPAISMHTRNFYALDASGSFIITFLTKRSRDSFVRENRAREIHSSLVRKIERRADAQGYGTTWMTDKNGRLVHAVV